MIADNRLSETSTWDDKLLAQQLNELSVLNLDFNLEDIGFEMAEIDLKIEGLNDRQDDADDPADVIPEPSSKPPISKSGDLWLLGRHRILCGNSLEPESYAALMQGERAAIVFTDPPYNVAIDGHASGLGATRHGDFAMASGEMSSTEFAEFSHPRLHAAGEQQRRWRRSLHLHGLAPPRRTARGRRQGLYGAQKCLCLGQT